jgi:hypothetical protein
MGDIKPLKAHIFMVHQYSLTFAATDRKHITDLSFLMRLSFSRYFISIIRYLIDRRKLDFERNT